MVAMASAIRPPPPRPWIARKAISSSMLWDQPASSEPTRNVMIAIWNSSLRP
jgi:hypothetical protein